MMCGSSGFRHQMCLSDWVSLSFQNYNEHDFYFPDRELHGYGLVNESPDCAVPWSVFSLPILLIIDVYNSGTQTHWVHQMHTDHSHNHKVTVDWSYLSDCNVGSTTQSYSYWNMVSKYKRPLQCLTKPSIVNMTTLERRQGFWFILL